MLINSLLSFSVDSEERGGGAECHVLAVSNPVKCRICRFYVNILEITFLSLISRPIRMFDTLSEKVPENLGLTQSRVSYLEIRISEDLVAKSYMSHKW